MERGLEEHPAEVWSPCRLPIGGDQSNCHLLPKCLSEKPRDARDGREAVGILALQQEHEGIDGDRQRVRPPQDETVEQPVVLSCEEIH